MTTNIFHLALRGEWDEAVTDQRPYDRSTLGVSLAEEGYIHCSFPHQVAATAERYYAGRDDVVVLVVDPDRVTAEVRVEDLHDSGVEFPHVYGPIPLDAVIETITVDEAAARAV